MGSSDGYRARGWRVPVGGGHRLGVGSQPHDLFLAEEASATQHGRPEPQLAKRADEFAQIFRAPGERPVDPADFVVLAVGVVVAALRAAELVAAEQQRHALRQQQRGQEVASLLEPER